MRNRIIGVMTVALVVALIQPASIAAAKPRPLLPNLVPLPTPSVLIGETGPYLGSASQPSFAINGCRVDEMLEQGARRCLRFDTAVANFGTGPVELRYRPAADIDAHLFQRVYRSDDTYFERLAAPSEFHPIHAHYHYTNFSITKLWRATSSGKIIGAKPVVTGPKNGFCFEDTTRVRGDEESRNYNCLDYEVDEIGPTRVTGISVGFADIYTYVLNGQYLEITGVGDGSYILETTIDPDKTVLEKTRADNTVRVLIAICGDSARVMRPGSKACK